MVKATPENLEHLSPHLPSQIMNVINKRGTIRQQMLIARMAMKIEARLKRHDGGKESSRYCDALVRTFPNNKYVQYVVSHYKGNGFANKIRDKARDAKIMKQKERQARNEAANKIYRERLQRQQDEENERRATFSELLDRDENAAIRFAASVNYATP